MVKYNNLDLSEYGEFLIPSQIGDFWNSLEKTAYPNEYDGSMSIITVKDNKLTISGYGGRIECQYSGYISFSFEAPEGLRIYVDDQLITNHNFEGNVEKHITFYNHNMPPMDILCTSLKLAPKTLQYSENTIKFWSAPLTKEKAWGELVLIPIGIERWKGLSWYNINNDISEQKMECLTYSPFITGADGISTNSGFYKCYSDVELDSNFPILIHEDDIGKKNMIGPLLQEDGSEIYINLTII